MKNFASRIKKIEQKIDNLTINKIDFTGPIPDSIECLVEGLNLDEHAKRVLWKSLLHGPRFTIKDLHMLLKEDEENAEKED
ncbi:MAG TPA: hypothetical protein VGD14_14530 [bacterium]